MCSNLAENSGGNSVVSVGIEPVDPSEFGKPPATTIADENRDEVDRLGEQRPRHCDDGFLDELLHAAHRAERGAGVDRADTSRVAGSPGFQQIERLCTAHLTDWDAIGPKPQR